MVFRFHSSSLFFFFFLFLFLLFFFATRRAASVHSHFIRNPHTLLYLSQQNMDFVSSTVRDALQETDREGKFTRVASTFREVIGDDHPVYKPEFGRYHLYISLACPWANRALSALVMKGLAAPYNAEAFTGHDSSFCVSYTVVHPTWQRTRKDDSNDTHCGWTFFDSYSPDSVPFTSSTGFGSFFPSGCILDPNDIKAQYIRDLYEKCSNNQYNTGKFTVPILWDKKTNSIVNNESSDIIRMVNHAFDEWASGPLKDMDLYPPALRESIDRINDWVYSDINDGVYKAGFAKSQQAYDEAVKKLYAGIKFKRILSSPR